MLVVTDQRPISFGRQRRLARTRQPEENRNVPVGTLVGRAVHSQHAPLRQQVVHDREDRLLDLAGITGAADNDESLREVQEDERFTPRVVDLGNGVELRAMNDHEVRLETVQRLGIKLTQEHVAGEHAVPRGLRDDAQRKPVLGIGTGVAVLHEDVTALEIGLETNLQQLEMLRVERPVVLAPPDPVLARGLTDDELVVG